MTLNKHFNAGWTIEVQEINVADRSAGAAGDIVVRRQNAIVLAAEVTERAVEVNRIVTTFNTKIAPSAITDYLFFVTDPAQPKSSQEQAEAYFAQGHEIAFVHIQRWMLQVLITLGTNGRETFNAILLELLSDPSTPQLVRTAWNQAIEGVTIISGSESSS
jgi:hypothetical protein